MVEVSKFLLVLLDVDPTTDAPFMGLPGAPSDVVVLRP